MTSEGFDLQAPARQLRALLTGVRDDQLAAQTPCASYTVGDLLDHLMGLTLEFTRAAAKAPQSAGSDGDDPKGPSGPGEASVAHLHPEWRHRLPLQLDALVAAWSEPTAWEGTTEAGGVTMPAEVMGTVVMDELVLHGWDLARGTSQVYECELSSAEVVFEFTSIMSLPGEEAGREGLFCPVVEVPAEASLFDRALGFSGRDPSWTPDWTP